MDVVEDPHEDVVDATRRTRLASERTYLAWWRTALAAFAVSLGVGKIVPELTGEVVFKTLFTAINRQGVVFLWPVRLPTPDDRKTEWARSQREAAEVAMAKWTRMKANMSLGTYEITIAESVVAEPEWPELTFQELVRIAYRDRMITSIEHPVIKRLRGLA